MSIITRFLALPDFFLCPSAVAAKFDVIQQGPFVTTVSDDPTNASMTWYLNEEALTSVLALVNAPVKSGLQTVLLLHPQSESELRVRDRPSNLNLRHLASRKTCSRTRSVRRPPLVTQIEIHTTPISIHTRARPLPHHQRTCGFPQIRLTTRYVSSSSLFFLDSLCRNHSMMSLRRIVEIHHICTIKVPIQNRPIHANST